MKVGGLPSLSLSAVEKVFQREGESGVRALDGVDLSVEAGEFVWILGPNGSGKSTLLNVVFGMVTKDRGQVLILTDRGPREVTSLRAHERARLMSRVTQDPASSSASSLTVWENLWLATELKGRRDLSRWASRRHIRRKFEQLLVSLGLEGKLDSLARELSLGQRQILGVVCALGRDPRLLILDEFTASLDEKNAEICLELAFELRQRSRSAALAVTHDLRQPMRQGDRVVIMHSGRISFDLPAQECRERGERWLAEAVLTPREEFPGKATV